MINRYWCLSLVLVGVFSLNNPLFAGDKGSGLKKKIAVVSFEDKSGGGNVGSGMSDMITTALVKSGKMMVIERQELDKVMNEQALGSSGAVSPQSAASLGKILGVELIVLGSVSEFGQKETNIGGNVSNGLIPRPSLPFGGALSGGGLNKKTARVSIDIRIVNTSSGEIVAAENISEDESKTGVSVNAEEFAFSNNSSFDNTLAGKATRRAIDRSVKLIVQNLDKVAWSGKVIKINDDGTMYIKPGLEGGVKNGDNFIVYSKGESIVDPDDGTILGAEETKAGAISVVDTKDKMSKAKITNGTAFKIGDIVREK